MFLCMWLHDGAGRWDPFYGSSFAMSYNEKLSFRIRGQLPCATWHFVHTFFLIVIMKAYYFIYATHLHITNGTVKILCEGGLLVS